nr:serine hydrolase domain-containing protein [Leucobacter edaphi]
MVAVASLGLTACSGGSGGGGNSGTDTIDSALSGSINGAVENAMQKSGSTEAIVGVWDGKKGEYVRGFGNEHLDGNSVIRGAQATQPVMCALLLEMAEEGKVKLDAEVSKDLTRQPGIDGITYRQLCDGRSGLADFKAGYTDMNANNPTRPWPEQEILAQGLAHSPLSWPGLDFHASDTDAVLLARALKVRSGEDINQLLSEHVFGPAGMGSASYNLSALTVSGTTMSGLTYPSSGGKPVCDADPVKVAEVSPTMLAGAGATTTSVTDLKKFYEKYLSGGFGGEKNSKLATEATPTTNPKRDKEGKPTEEVKPEGQQWAFGTEKMDALYGRAGSITGTATAAYHDPSTGYTVIVSLNNSSSGGGIARALAFEIAALSKASGTGPEVGWSAEDQQKQIGELAICQK